MNTLPYGSPTSNQFTYEKMDDFTGLIKSYWDDLIEQVVPATTLWGSVKVYTNTLFDQQKFKYKNYTSLFGKNSFENITVSNPINGVSGQCQTVEVIVTPISALVETNNVLNSGKYTNICISQMNSGSEFIGTVSVFNEDDLFYNL
jgi:hypothetical protein